MTTFNSSSATSSYPLPNADNPLNMDVGRIITSFELIDGHMTARLPIASYTASDVMVKVKSLDGAGSGLDADTLDGQQAAAFAAASHAHAEATTGAAGFMAAADKAKLNGIGTGANVISVNAQTGIVSLTHEDVGAAVWNHGHARAWAGADGFISGPDQHKLNGIGAGANVISVNAKTGVVSLSHTDVGAASSGHTHANATSGAAGFMAAADKAKLDGITPASYIATGTAYTTSQQIPGVSLNTTIVGNPHNFYEVRGNGAAALAFHRPGVFAAFFGLDSDNQWKVGGWSYGAAAYRIWHEGNHGAGSGLDADTLDGYHATAFAAAYHTHVGGQIPVVKSIQNVFLASAAGSATTNVTISAVDTTKSIIVLSGDPQSNFYIALSSATNVQVTAIQNTFNLRFQVVEFY